MNRNYYTHLLLLLLMAFSFNQCMSPKNPKAKKNSTNEAILETTEIQKAGDKTVEAEVNRSNKPEQKKKIRTSVTKIPKNTIYIPKGIDPKEKNPVIFIFDPHGRGMLAVEKYQKLADDYGFVLIASNQSKNSQPLEQGLAYYQKMKEELAHKITMDTQKIYTLGFSGGARLAVSIAIQESEINSVIGCGAGFPTIKQLPTPNFYYLGIVGYEDFNMGELINNDRYLSRSGFQNELVIFDGGHDWPPAEVMREAFLTLQINDINQNMSSSNQEIIDETFGYYTAMIDDYVDKGSYFDAAETAERATTTLKDVGDVSGYKSQINTFKKNQAYTRDFSAMVKTMETETGKQNNYVNAFEQKDLEWWREEIKTIKTPNDDLYQNRLNQRLSAFLGLISYMMSNKAIRENNMVQAQKDIDIYRMIEPTNPEAAYLNATVKMKLGDETSAEAFMQLAIAFGFNDTERFINDPNFKNLKKKDEFLGMMR